MLARQRKKQMAAAKPLLKIFAAARAAALEQRLDWARAPAAAGPAPQWPRRASRQSTSGAGRWRWTRDAGRGKHGARQSPSPATAAWPPVRPPAGDSHPGKTRRRARGERRRLGRADEVRARGRRGCSFRLGSAGGAILFQQPLRFIKHVRRHDPAADLVLHLIDHRTPIRLPLPATPSARPVRV